VELSTLKRGAEMSKTPSDCLLFMPEPTLKALGKGIESRAQPGDHPPKGDLEG
jgi:hypothetical protein